MKRILFFFLLLASLVFPFEAELEVKYLTFSNTEEHKYGIKRFIKLKENIFALGFYEGTFKQKSGGKYHDGIIFLKGNLKNLSLGFMYMPYSVEVISSYAKGVNLTLKKERWNFAFYYTNLNFNLSVVQISPSFEFSHKGIDFEMGTDLFYYDKKFVDGFILPGKYLFAVKSGVSYKFLHVEAFVGNRLFSYEEGGFEFHSHPEKHLYGGKVKLSYEIKDFKFSGKFLLSFYRELESLRRAKVFGIGFSVEKEF